MPVATSPKLNREVLSRNVLAHLRRSQKPLRPMQLIRDMAENYSYSDVQSAVSSLLEKRQIRLTPDRFVVIHNRQSGGQ
jgi:hypothetical protein